MLQLYGRRACLDECLLDSRIDDARGAGRAGRGAARAANCASLRRVATNERDWRGSAPGAASRGDFKFTLARETMAVSFQLARVVAALLLAPIASSTDSVPSSALPAHRNPVLCVPRSSRGLADGNRQPRADVPCDGWGELRSVLGSDFQLDGYPLGKTPVAQWPQGFFGLLAGPLLAVHSLTLQLGSAGYAELATPVVIDLGGWSPSSLRGGARRTTTFDRRRTDHTMETFWVPVLRKLLPLVERVTLRGFGPELSVRTYVGSYGPQGWLRLELHQGPYPPTFQGIIPNATVLEMAALHDARWSSSPAQCATNQGLDVPSEAIAEALKSTEANDYFETNNGVPARIPYACMWRASIDALLSDPERVVFFTAGHGVEVLVAKRNLEIAGEMTALWRR